MNIQTYITEIKEKTNLYSDRSACINYQETVEKEVLVLLTRIYLLYSKKFPLDTKFFHLVVNNGEYIFTSEQPISFISNNGKKCSNETFITTIIEEINDLVKFVNIYNDDKYFSLIFKEENGKFIISFQNRFWLKNVTHKLNYMEGVD